MSDVVVTVVESNTNVTVTEQDVAVAVTETSVDVSTSTAGIQGATGATGAGYSGVTSVSTITIGSGLKTFTLVSGNQGAFLTGMRVRAIHSDTPTYYMEGTANYVGAGTLIITVDKFNGSGSHNSWAFSVAGEVGQTGATGASGVVSVTSPITNTGTSGSAIVGIDQTLLAIAQSQVTNLVSDLANRAKLDTANAFTVGGHVITNAATAVVPLALKAVASQSANTLELQNSSGSPITYFTASGRAVIGSDSSAMLNVVANATAVIPLVIKGASGQSGDYLQVQTSAGGIVAKMTSSANPRFNLGTTDLSATLGVNGHASGGVVAVIRGAASQSVDLLQVQNSASTNLFRVDQFGGIYSTFASFTSDAAATRPLLVKGAASQSANLQSWQNSAAANLATVDSSGNVRGNSVRTNSDYTSLLEANSGGYVRLTKQSAATPNPGANLGSLYFRDGTNAGTLKLVVRAGAAGAETTILDNIPQ